MNFRIHPIWWPILIILSPILLPWLIIKYIKFIKNKTKAENINNERINSTKMIDLPELDYLEIDIIVEMKSQKGFIGDAGVSYLLKTNKGKMLFDIGHGSENPAFNNNAKNFNLNMNQVDSLAISHLHKDHIGGLNAARKKIVSIPKEYKPLIYKNCFLPDKAEANDFFPKLVDSPQVLGCGIASTGPLARSLFFFGYTEEQALLLRLKNKGLVVITGCGHPKIEVILKMVKKISNEPIYAIGGGLHFPIKDGRGNKAGIQFQTYIGTGKPLWEKIKIKDADKAIEAINKAQPKKVFLSAHDSSDFALDYFSKKINADTKIFTAGKSYIF